MLGHEPRPDIDPADQSGSTNEAKAETNGQLDSESKELQAKFEGKLDRFSKQMMGKANYYINLIADRREELGRLEAEANRSAQELTQAEDEFERLGGRGRLTPQACERAEAAYSSYLAEHHSRQILAASSEAHADCQDCARHPGLVADPVSYRDFLIYGILRLDTPQINAQDHTEPINKLLQPLTISQPPRGSALQKEEQAVAYIPSLNQEQFDQLKQSRDPSNSSLLLDRLTEHGGDDFGQPIFGFGAYQTGHLDPRDPAVGRVIESAADHMVIKRNHRPVNSRLTTDINGSRQALQRLDRKLVTT